MESQRFDRLAKLVAGVSSRRVVVRGLLGAGLAGAFGHAEARKRNRKGKHRRKRDHAALSSEAADCLSPGPSSNMNGCNFNNQDFVDADLSSSAMRGTKFRGANLCGADLSSSQLKRADFRGFAAPGNATNLFRADLSSSGCNGTRFNQRTLFCQTKTCNGAISDRDCPDGVDPEDVCCSDADCGAGLICNNGICEDCGGAVGETCAENEECCSGLCACGSIDVDTCMALNFSQNFNQNLDFWYQLTMAGVVEPPTPAVLERVPSGTDGIVTQDGGDYAQVKANNSYNGDLSAFTTMGGYSNVFPDDGFEVLLDIYLDPEAAEDGQVFAYTSALSSTICTHFQDYAFFAGQHEGQYCVGVSTNVANPPNPCNSSYDPKSVSEAGWYTFKHSFAKVGGDVIVTMQILDANGNAGGRQWEITASDPNEPGGNRYGWFALNSFPFVGIDNNKRNS